MNHLPQRKPNRLQGFDYCMPTAYFVTICVKDRQCLLGAIKGTIVGASIARPPTHTLTNAGKIVDAAIQAIPQHYPSVQVDKYVIMPNHIHMILRICTAESGRAMLAPTTVSSSDSDVPSVSVSKIIQHMKGVVTKSLGYSLWQKSFHDHIIRTEEGYREIWDYIDANPFRWTEDCFFQP